MLCCEILLLIILLFAYTNSFMNKKIILMLSCLMFVLLFSNYATAANVVQNRWVYYSMKIQNENALSEFIKFAKDASRYEYNGIIVAASFDIISDNMIRYGSIYHSMKKICDKLNLDIIPMLASVGYAGPIIYRNRNIAAAFAINEVDCVINNNIVKLNIDDLNDFIFYENFENTNQNFLASFDLQDSPGSQTFIDSTIYYYGTSSLKFDISKNKKNLRIAKKIKITPYKSCNISFYLRSCDMNLKDKVSIKILRDDNTCVIEKDFDVNNDERWIKVDLDFNSLDNEVLNVYIGVWNGDKGEFWIDELLISYNNNFNNLIVNNSAKVSIVDIVNKNLIYEGDNVSLLSNYTLRINDSVTISNLYNYKINYYKSYLLNKDQIGVCLTGQSLYDHLKKQIAVIHKIFSPKFYFLSIDEIRQSCMCQSCRDVSGGMAEILGQCVDRLHKIIGSFDNNAKVLVWSDMFDPNVNGKTTKYYMSTTTGNLSWLYLPKEVIPVLWDSSTASDSLQHFYKNGFTVMIASYYDDKTMQISNRWKQASRCFDNINGYIYTTWKNDYSNLKNF